MPVDLQQSARVLPTLFLAWSVIFVGAVGCRKSSPPADPPARAESLDGIRPVSDAAQPAEKAVDPDPERDDQQLNAAPPTAELGQQLYARHCAACHGAQGDGQGLAAAYLFPKPRDIQAGRFRLISTSNQVPSREDLHAILLRGMPGSSMPPWGHLSQLERDALVDEIMRLRLIGATRQFVKILKEEEELTDEEIAAEDVQQEIQEYVARLKTPGESTLVPEMGAPTEEGMARAKDTYARYGCLQCHGKEGKGDGIQKMIDEEGYPTAPRDFTAGIFKGGADPASIYRRIAYGMPGTPMPSSSQMTPEQMVELVHYILAMSTEKQRAAAVLNREKIVVRSVDALPEEASTEAWNHIEATALRMTPLWWRDGADPDFHVQAVHDHNTIVVRLTWNDAAPDQHALESEAFEDGVAMELYRGEQEPFIGMGDPNSPLDVWFWDADREVAADLEDRYPNVVVDLYPFSEPLATTPEFRREGTKLANQPDVSLPALAAGNQIAPGHAATGGSNLTAGGLGSATFRLPRSQLVSARGSWAAGRWTVLMTRSLGTATPDDGVSLEPGGKASVAFAVWDGAAQDRDGRKLISIWQDLILEP